MQVWEPASDPAVGGVISPTPVYTFPSDQQEGSGGGGGGRGRLEELNGVLAMCGLADAQGRSVLLVSYNTDTVSGGRGVPFQAQG